jgi:hypothetical protein
MVRGDYASPAVQGAEDSAHEVSLETPQSFPPALAFAHLLGHEGLRGRMHAALGHGEAMQGGIELPIAFAV